MTTTKTAFPSKDFTTAALNCSMVAVSSLLASSTAAEDSECLPVNVLRETRTFNAVGFSFSSVNCLIEKRLDNNNKRNHVNKRGLLTNLIKLWR